MSEPTVDQEFKKEVRDTLKQHTAVLGDIKETLGKIAVQDEQIRTLRADVNDVANKVDAMLDPERGTLARLSGFQGSCPRGQIKWLWTIVIPQGVGILAVAGKIMGLF